MTALVARIVSCKSVIVFNYNFIAIYRMTRPENLWGDISCRNSRAFVCRRPCAEKNSPRQKDAGQNDAEGKSTRFVGVVGGALVILGLILAWEKWNVRVLKKKLADIEAVEEKSLDISRSNFADPIQPIVVSSRF